MLRDILPLLENRRVLAITVRLLRNIARTATSGFSRPARARGIAKEL